MSGSNAVIAMSAPTVRPRPLQDPCRGDGSVTPEGECVLIAECCCGLVPQWDGAKQHADSTVTSPEPQQRPGRPGIPYARATLLMSGMAGDAGASPAPWGASKGQTGKPAPAISFGSGK